MGETLEDLFTKISHFVISHVIKTWLSPFHRDITTETKGSDNTEDCLSCDNSLYNERNLEVFNSDNGVYSGSKDEKFEGGMDALEMELTSTRLCEW